MNSLDSFKELRLINKSLFTAIIVLFIFFAAEFLRLESYAITSIFRGSFSFSELPELFNYNSFIPVISFLLLFLVIKNLARIAEEEKINYLISLIVIIFVLQYLFKFFFIERLVSLYAFSANSLPDSITYFLPFDWYDIRNGYVDFRSDFDPGWYKFQFILALISAMSVLVAIIYLTRLVNSNKVKIEIKKGLLYLKSSINTTKAKIVVISVVLVFSIFGIQNIKAWDYSVITTEVSFAQEDLIDFQEELKLANQKMFESEKLEARKVAASKAYSSISGREERFEIDLSLWSSDLEELGSGVVEWIVLWKKLLREMSTRGYSEPETIFDLTQKYSEISSLGVLLAPQLTPDYNIDFWDDEFYPLVR